MLGNIGPMELIIVAIIALVVLGPKRLPDAGRSLGRGMREFKTAISGASDEDEQLTPLPVATADKTPVA
jgi:sec-independent protein translocase protein TatA